MDTFNLYAWIKKNKKDLNFKKLNNFSEELDIIIDQLTNFFVYILEIKLTPVQILF